MNPWSIIGWFVVVFMIGIPLAAAMVKVGYAVVQDVRKSHKLKRANAGKLTCEYVEPEMVPTWCHNVATRRTTTGFFCNEHNQSRQARGYGSFSFSSPLDHTLTK